MLSSYSRKILKKCKISGLGIRIFIWNRFPIKVLMIDWTASPVGRLITWEKMCRAKFYLSKITCFLLWLLSTAEQGLFENISRSTNLDKITIYLQNTRYGCTLAFTVACLCFLHVRCLCLLFALVGHRKVSYRHILTTFAVYYAFHR